MNKINKLIYLIIFLLVLSCSGKEKKVDMITEENIELQMIDSYKEGLRLLNEGDSLSAAKKFNQAELLFPQSEWAPKSLLMAAYAFYSQDYYGDAVSELRRFIKTYPKHERLGYAHYLLAVCHYETIVDEKKDLNSILESKKEFEYLINNYPNTDFAIDSKFKLDLINELLASKEIYLGRYYMKKTKWVAAINRFKNVIDEYETTIYTDEALHRLVEIHYKIGLNGEAKKYASTLGYNYQSSEWYEESYKILNKDYKDPIKELKKDDKNFILKKFKSIFN
jgi:outer membrane protein assembly factor BamD